MLASLFFFASLAILWYVKQKHVHIHIEFSNSPVRQRVKTGRRATAERLRSGNLIQPLPLVTGETPESRDVERSAITDLPRAARAMTRPVPIDSVVWGDISSALENLGAKPHRARAAAQHVVRNWPDAGFDVQFREALKEVQAA